MNPIDFNAKRKATDRKLRRAILTLLEISLGIGRSEVQADDLVDNINDTAIGDNRFRDAGHALGLIRSLVIKGLVAERLRPGTVPDQASLKSMRVSLTERGMQLLNGTLPVDADVADDRDPWGNE